LSAAHPALHSFPTRRSSDLTMMYFADTARARIDRFHVDPATGELSDRMLFAHVTGGGPDGMTVDDEDHLWVAVWGASEVRRFGPDRKSTRLNSSHGSISYAV